jgi:hypothetical protein
MLFSGAKLFRDAVGDFEVDCHHDARSKSSSSFSANRNAGTCKLIEVTKHLRQ